MVDDDVGDGDNGGGAVASSVAILVVSIHADYGAALCFCNLPWRHLQGDYDAAVTIKHVPVFRGDIVPHVRQRLADLVFLFGRVLGIDWVQKDRIYRWRFQKQISPNRDRMFKETIM